MARLDRISATAWILLIALGTVSAPPHAAAEPASPPRCTGSHPVTRYVVLFDPGQPRPSAHRDVTSRCGSLTHYYREIGVGIATSPDPAFADRLGQDRAYSAERETALDRTAHSLGSSPQSETRGGQPAAEQWNNEAIHTAAAHAITSGDPDVVVGVLDSGIDPTHPELSHALDPSRSVSCLGGVPDPHPAAWSASPSRHGTHVAGIIAAADDGHGITGVAPRTRVASVRVVDDQGYVHPEYAVCGYMWSAQHGIRVANSSFLVESAHYGCGGNSGSTVPREAVRRAVDHATARGVLTVAAIGNRRLDLSSSQPDRSRCDAVPAHLDNVLTVSAVSPDGQRADYSSYGLGAVDLAGPGGEHRAGRSGDGCVRSTVPGGYGTSCGTSMAAPHVSGTAALIAARHPDAAPAELADRLVRTATSLPCPPDPSTTTARCTGDALDNAFHGHGLVDALRAVSD